MKVTNQLMVIIACLFSLLITAPSLAQENWVSYSHQIPAKEYEGLRFRLQAFVKSKVEDDSASARLWARVDLEKGSGFFENMWNSPIRSSEWKSYSIEGIIDSNANALTFGALCQFNGKFYYDDFKLEVEKEKDKWITVFTSDFENSSEDWTQGIYIGEYGINSAFKEEIIYGKAAKDNGCLLIEGKNVLNYGSDKVGKYADVNGIKLYYEIYGEGHPLVVLHGNGGSIKSAAPHYPELIKKYKVIAIDSRGQGRSTDTDDELTYYQMAADVNALLNKLNIDSVFIWGQSDGAIIGLILAMDYPEKVKKVLAFGANIQPDSLAVFSWAIKSDEKTLKTTTDAKVRKLITLMVKYPTIPYSKLSQIKAPVLIMVGDRDVIRPEHTLKLFQNIPNSQLCILPGTTHGAAWAKKKLFLQILVDFFDKPFKMPSTENWYK